MKSGCSGALKPDRCDLSCRANECSDAGTGDLSVLAAHEICSKVPTLNGWNEQTGTKVGSNEVLSGLHEVNSPKRHTRF